MVAMYVAKIHIILLFKSYSYVGTVVHLSLSGQYNLAACGTSFSAQQAPMGFISKK